MKMSKPDQNLIQVDENIHSHNTDLRHNEIINTTRLKALIEM